MVVSLSALRTGPFLPPGNTHGTHFCWRLNRPQGHSAIGRLCQWKIPMIPFGIEPATFRFVAQNLNHCANAISTYHIWENEISYKVNFFYFTTSCGLSSSKRTKLFKLNCDTEKRNWLCNYKTFFYYSATIVINSLGLRNWKAIQGKEVQQLFISGIIARVLSMQLILRRMTKIEIVFKVSGHKAWVLRKIAGKNERIIGI